jgi:NOL1/NOP2/fmu family ribosome biogenesis protein
MIKLKKTAEIEPIEGAKSKKSYTYEFLKSDDKKIKKYLTLVSEVFGIDENVFNEFNFILKRNDLFFINKNWNTHTPGIFHRVGTKFGTIDNKDNLVLHTHASQILKYHITKNIYQVKDKEELRIYLAGGLIPSNERELGQYVIKYNDYVLGTAVVTSGGIKSRFPRSKRTQKIRLGEF